MRSLKEIDLLQLNRPRVCQRPLRLSHANIGLSSIYTKPCHVATEAIFPQPQPI